MSRRPSPLLSLTERLSREAPIAPPTLDLHVYPPFAEFIGESSPQLGVERRPNGDAASEFGGASKHVLTNAGSSRMVFKVKCSNNSLFKVRSPRHEISRPKDEREGRR